jgi:hypothetical protein
MARHLFRRSGSVAAGGAQPCHAGQVQVTLKDWETGLDPVDKLFDPS